MGNPVKPWSYVPFEGKNPTTGPTTHQPHVIRVHDELLEVGVGELDDGVLAARPASSSAGSAARRLSSEPVGDDLRGDALRLLHDGLRRAAAVEVGRLLLVGTEHFDGGEALDC